MENTKRLDLLAFITSFKYFKSIVHLLLQFKTKDAALKPEKILENHIFSLGTKFI